MADIINNQEVKEDRQAQRRMHQSFFDDCQRARDNGFYMEAILMEYAAIEARMEILLGVIGLPCNKFANDKDRMSIQISHRIYCAKEIMKESKIFAKTGLPKNYFKNLHEWIQERDRYIHGLYKSEIKYSGRIKNAKNMAEKGQKYCEALYKEVNRVKRLVKKHPELISEAQIIICHSQKCTRKQ